MEEDAGRLGRLGRLCGAKDFDGEAHGCGAGAVARLGHDEPATFASHLAGPVPIYPTSGALESWRGGLSRAGTCEEAEENE